PRHVTSDHPESSHIPSAGPRSSRSVHHNPSLISCLRDAPLVSAHSAGIPKPTHLTPPVLELIPLSAALSIMGIALWCVWAAYTATESPEVAACAAEPLEVVASAVASPEAMTPAAVSPELASEAAEPHETGTSALAPCTVVVPSDTHLACGSSSCPVLAMYELSAPPVMAMEAVTELSAHPVMAMEAICDHCACPIAAKQAVYELPVCLVPAREAAYVLKSGFEPAMETECELSIHLALTDVSIFTLPITSSETTYGLSVCPTYDSNCELSTQPISLNTSNVELSTLSVVLTETANTPTAFPASVLVALSFPSVSIIPRSPALSSLLWRSSAPPWWAPAL
ncbi:hypothetical protein M9458_001348, partial [Cirrhinus mrigala]